MAAKHTCTWLSDDPPQWTRLKWVLGVLGAVTTAISIYALVRRIWLEASPPAPGTPESSHLPFLLSIALPLALEVAAYSLWGLWVLLLFMGSMIRLFTYHSLRVMCPLATPTLSDRIAHSQIASGWVHSQTQRLHTRVKLLECEDGLHFSETEGPEFASFLTSLVGDLQRDGGLRQVIAVTPVTQLAYESPFSLNIWDPFVEHIRGRSRSAQKKRRLYYVVNFHSTYNQEHYDPSMENITSALELAPATVEARVLYRDGTFLSDAQQEALSPFFDGFSKHYLAIQTHKGWIVCFADIGGSTGEFREGVVYEHSGSQSEAAGASMALLQAIRDLDKGGRSIELWHIGDDEKSKRHVYLFGRLSDGDQAMFCDWEIAIRDWNEDRLVQIRRATRDAITKGLPIRRLFVVPKGNDDIRRKALNEAAQQMPGSDQDSLHEHFGYVVFPDDTLLQWPELKHLVTTKIAKSGADFALYKFKDAEDFLYVNNFDGATRVLESEVVDTTEQAFNRLWDKRSSLEQEMP